MQKNKKQKTKQKPKPKPNKQTNKKSAGSPLSPNCLSHSLPGHCYASVEQLTSECIVPTGLIIPSYGNPV